MKPRLAIVGEAWGEHEASLKHPFVGTSGVELLRMMDDAKLIELSPHHHSLISAFWSTKDPTYTKMVWSDFKDDIFLTNVFNLRPPNNKIEALCSPKKEVKNTLPLISQGKYIRDEFLPELTRLQRELVELQPNLVLALGNTATWALLRNSGITKIRGAIAHSVNPPGLKVLPTYHPAAVMRKYDYRPVVVMDLIKAKREVEFPEIRRPQRTIYIEPSLDDLEWFWNEFIIGARYIAPDIETKAKQITCIGFAVNNSVALVVPFVDRRKPNSSYWATAEEEFKAWRFVERVLRTNIPKIFQNGLYDLQWLYRLVGIRTARAEEDSMLMHHSMMPEMPKGLGFLGSLYTNEASWKLMREREQGTLKRDA